ncbi:MAG: response regulator [Candidatus Azobacteroides sp.]|nr:response regulator [Candidatus Azobacteroides sp.]
MKKSIVLFFCIFSFFSGSGSERYYFSNLSLEDGLSQITVLCSFQDSQGFLWFGTRNGLNRYDGYGFEVFRNEPGNNTCISDNHILCITEDAGRNIWIGTNNGLNKLDVSTDKAVRYYHNEEDHTSISHNIISALLVDPEKRLWVGTGSGLNLYDPETGTFSSINPDGLFTNNPVNSIKWCDGELVIGTTYQGLVFLNPQNNKYIIYKNNPKDVNSLSNNYIRTILIDDDKNVWIGTNGGGLNKLTKTTGKFIRYNKTTGLNNDYVRCLEKSPEGDILIGTFNGMDVLDFETGKFTHYNTYDSSRGDLSHYSVYTILFDRSHTLWVGTYAGGIDYYNQLTRVFRYYNPGMDELDILGVIGTVVEYGTFLYFATEGGGLLEFDKETGKFRHYMLTKEADISYGKNILKILYLDHGKILCGTNVGTVYSFDPATKKFSLLYQFDWEDSVYVIQRDSSDCMMLGGVGLIGLTRITSGGIRQTNFPVKGRKNITFPNVRCLLETKKNIFLIGTRADGLFRYDADNEMLIQYRHKEGVKSPDDLPENYISTIFRDSKSRIWIGTFGGGLCLFDGQGSKFKVYDAESGLVNNNICSIIESKDGHLWISTIDGISDFNPADDSFRNYTYSNGIKIKEFTPNAGIMTRQGEIYFCGNNGFVSFDPGNIFSNPYLPAIVLDELYVNNQKILPAGEDKILNKKIGWTKEITLKYNQSNFSIRYSALNFIFPDMNQYAYKLDGFDNRWNEVGNRRIAYYTNVPPGTYTFRVRGSNNDGIWNNEEAGIVIKVLPPFWKTWWAYTFYGLAMAYFLLLIFRYFKEKERLENDILLKQMETKAREEFHQTRNKLFTNFSHELRTPLTLIISPLEDIIVQEDLSLKLKQHLLLIRNNARRLLRLVNNLMDFQKKESGTMQLKVAEGNVVKFVEEMYLLFNELAMSRNIRFTFSHSKERITCWYDRDLMEKVFFNFLSNAFKNTPNGGSVEVKLDSTSLEKLKKQYPVQSQSFHDAGIEYLVIEIADSGSGIPVEELEKIFIPFYQVAQNEHIGSGTGLGLSLSRSIIEMHHGIVWAESPEKKGAVFSCILPVAKNLFSENEIANDFKNSEDIRHYEVDIPVEEIIESSQKKKTHTLLIVEDNPDVRHYIISHLSADYNILEASNGVEAVEKSIHYLPDLIISDLMMPKMDGLEMASVLKNDIRTGHIPIIMITARTTVHDIRDGYETGVDDYITKPFNAVLLKTRVRNMLSTREKLKELYGKRFSLETLGVEVTSIDEKFLQKLYEVMEKNISNPELNLDGFCREIGMSRANLYRKIKAITNLSPNEFIRNFRLEMSAKILRETGMSVSDVFVAVGFNSLAYFSNCFKALYGISPTEYVRRQKG